MIGPDGQKFRWGTITKIHVIDPFHKYEIVEYMSSMGTLFHAYVNGQDTRKAYTTLEEAIVFAIAYGRTDAEAAAYLSEFFFDTLRARE
jgi:hypothetical protein